MKKINSKGNFYYILYLTAFLAIFSIFINNSSSASTLSSDDDIFSLFNEDDKDISPLEEFNNKKAKSFILFLPNGKKRRREIDEFLKEKKISDARGFYYNGMSLSGFSDKMDLSNPEARAQAEEICVGILNFIPEEYRDCAEKLRIFNREIFGIK